MLLSENLRTTEMDNPGLNWFTFNSDSTFNGMILLTKKFNIQSYLSGHKFQVKTRIELKSTIFRHLVDTSSISSDLPVTPCEWTLQGIIPADAFKHCALLHCCNRLCWAAQVVIVSECFNSMCAADISEVELGVTEILDLQEEWEAHRVSLNEKNIIFLSYFEIQFLKNWIFEKLDVKPPFPPNEVYGSYFYPIFPTWGHHHTPPIIITCTVHSSSLK